MACPYKTLPAEPNYVAWTRRNGIRTCIMSVSYNVVDYLFYISENVTIHYQYHILICIHACIHATKQWYCVLPRVSIKKRFSYYFGSVTALFYNHICYSVSCLANCPPFKVLFMDSVKLISVYLKLHVELKFLCIG